MISSVDSVSPRHDAGDERHPDAVMLGRPRRAESDTLPCAVQHHAVQTQLTPATLLQIPWKRASFLRGLADALTQNRVFLETPGKLCGGVLAPFGIQGDSSDRLRGNRSNQNSASNQQLRSCDGNEETMQKWANSRVMSTSKHCTSLLADPLWRGPKNELPAPGRIYSGVQSIRYTFRRSLLHTEVSPSFSRYSHHGVSSAYNPCYVRRRVGRSMMSLYMTGETGGRIMRWNPEDGVY